MENYKNYEYWIENKCKYWLAISVSSCRRCLFEALCCYEKNQERINKEKEKSDLSDNLE